MAAWQLMFELEQSLQLAVFWPSHALPSIEDHYALPDSEMTMFCNHWLVRQVCSPHKKRKDGWISRLKQSVHHIQSILEKIKILSCLVYHKHSNNNWSNVSAYLPRMDELHNFP